MPAFGLPFVRRTVVAMALAALAFSPGGAQTVAADPATRPAPVTLQSFSVMVRDYDEALRWYTEALGFVAMRDQRFGASERFTTVAPSKPSETGIVLPLRARK